MNLKRRDSASAPEEKDAPKQSGGRKPVIVYIFVLFAVAFLLMIWSLFTHQRSNTEALGELQTSVSAMQEVQGLQEQVIRLQQELAETQSALDQAQEAAETAAAAQEESAAANDKLAALTNLYLLEHAYQSEDYDSCRQIIDHMEREGQPALLTIDDSLEGVVFPSFYNAPRIVYDNVKEALEAGTP